MLLGFFGGNSGTLTNLEGAYSESDYFCGEAAEALCTSEPQMNVQNYQIILYQENHKLPLYATKKCNQWVDYVQI